MMSEVINGLKWEKGAQKGYTSKNGRKKILQDQNIIKRK